MRLASVCSMIVLGVAAGVAGAQVETQQALVQPAPDEALQLLDKVAMHYSEAESVHLEVTETSRIHSDLMESTQTEYLSAYRSPGERFRYDGRDAHGSGMIVSDGTTEWRLLRSLREYAREPTGIYFRTRPVSGNDDNAVFAAWNLLLGLTRLGDGLHSAHLETPETVEFGGRQVRCTVVRYGREDFTRSAGPLQTGRFDTYVWIDPETLRVLKQEQRAESRPLYGRQPAPYGPVSESVRTTTYTVADLNFEPQHDSYYFIAPGDSREVAALPKLAPLTGGSSAPPGPTLEARAKDAHLDKPLPEVILRDVDGKDVALSSFAGKPLLIDVWATWCVPCMTEMPALDKIRKSTAQTDLQMLGVDQDQKPADSVAFLKRRGYDWPDMHYTADFAKQMMLHGIPLTVLVDATGKVVYYHTGAGDTKGLVEAIARLGPEYASVRGD